MKIRAHIGGGGSGGGNIGDSGASTRRPSSELAALHVSFAGGVVWTSSEPPEPAENPDKRLDTPDMFDGILEIERPGVVISGEGASRLSGSRGGLSDRSDKGTRGDGVLCATDDVVPDGASTEPDLLDDNVCSAGGASPDLAAP